MIWKYSTREVNGKQYICGCRLISETGTPGDDFEFAVPFAAELVDARGKLRFTITKLKGGDYDIVEDPELQTDVEVAVDMARDIHKARRAAYTVEAELDIMRRALETVRDFAAKLGIDVPGLEEWDEYKAKLKGLGA